MKFPAIILALLTLILIAAPAIAAKSPRPIAKAETAKKVTRPTLQALIEYVMKNGTERNIEAPLSRSLGFSTDVVPTKAMRHKSKASLDKRTHAVYVAFGKDKAGKPIAQELVLIGGLVSVKDGKKYIDGVNYRADKNGRLLSAVKSTGLMEDVVLTVLSADSQAVTSGFSSECAIHLEKMDMFKLEK